MCQLRPIFNSSSSDLRFKWREYLPAAGNWAHEMPDMVFEELYETENLYPILLEEVP
ncbi:7639_t:CDS:2 [Rhizophagus irregularis]|nr:7639_t:CDS:2 [Rhizophagus irregularis]